MRGGLRGEGGVVSTPDATSIAGVTPTAAGLALLDDADAAAQRTTLGLGTIATQAANNVSISGGSITGITALGVAAGGTGGGTTLLGRSGLSANGGGWRTTSSGTDTLVAGDGVVEYTASCTITLPSASASGVFVGKTITLIAATAGIVLTLQRAGSDTLNGGTSTVAVTMPTVRGTLAVVAQSSSAWGSLQPGSLIANGFRWYISSGSVWFVATCTLGSGAIIDLSAPLQATSTADPSTFGCTLSGSSVVVPNGAIGVSGTIPTRGQYWGAALSALNLSYPTAQHLTTYRTNWGALTGTRGGASVSICMLTSVTTFGGIQRGVGVNFSTTGSNFNPCWYTSGNLFANVSGATTTDGVSSVVVQLSSVVQPNNLQRYSAGAYVDDYTGGNGNNTTAQFDRAALWIGIGTGTVSPGFSLAGLNGTVQWAATV